MKAAKFRVNFLLNLCKIKLNTLKKRIKRYFVSVIYLKNSHNLGMFTNFLKLQKSLSLVIFVFINGACAVVLDSGAKTSVDLSELNNLSLSTTMEVPLEMSITDLQGLEFTIISEPQMGTLTGDGPDYTYTPSLNWTGTDTYVVRVSNGEVTKDIESSVEVAFGDNDQIEDVPSLVDVEFTTTSLTRDSTYMNICGSHNGSATQGIEVRVKNNSKYFVVVTVGTPTTTSACGAEISSCDSKIVGQPIEIRPGEEYSVSDKVYAYMTPKANIVTQADYLVTYQPRYVVNAFSDPGGFLGLNNLAETFTSAHMIKRLLVGESIESNAFKTTPKMFFKQFTSSSSISMSGTVTRGEHDFECGG
jgi:hypothetical protein